MAGAPSEWPDGSAVRLDRRDPYLRLQSVTIFVRNLDRSLDFYVKQLGFQLAFDARSQKFIGRHFVTVAPPDGQANLTLVAPERDSEQYKLIGRHTQVTFVTEDVLAKFREWSARGVRFLANPRLKRLKYPVRLEPARSLASSAEAEHPPIWGGVFARFRDPDGNSFSLVSFDEVTHAVEAQRRAIAEKIETERRAAQELDIAKQVQARLFPQTLPPLKTLEYAGVCRQARQVGGDYYDFLDLGGERLGFVIGDISGKGIAAALLMANLQANLRSQSAIAVDQPQRLLRSVNQLFCENTTDGAFATLFFAEYDDATRRLRYANCGHLAALLLRRDDSIERLESTATVLGVFKRWDCEISETQVFSGDILALYTDGITESFNDADEQFGEERLAAALCRDRTLSSNQLLNTIVEKVRQFSPREQHDDITLIIAKSL
ncbi:MAG TPA: SpoIIE family protein phosphatase [Candidatus Acidoferrum sp.]|jgi:serine phosphatase RsbU (regulator of sigma subunit)/catechol 2,3-dioxygenase-like lactoylglutathione lyase family enzyme|nr:SpoIIE family protein phosphatase [Candidatus Acidoferrum sp.]